MDTKTREIVERLQALGDNPKLHETAQACTGCIDNFSEYAGNNIFRGFVIDLLERSDPDEWTDERLREWGLVRLPKDKDGEYIHVGDTVWHESLGKVEVKSICIDGNGDAVYCVNDYGQDDNASPYYYTHHPPVTVESLLLEFGKICADGYDIGNNIAEFAKRLRLAEVDE